MEEKGNVWLRQSFYKRAERGSPQRNPVESNLVDHLINCQTISRNNIGNGNARK